MRWFDSQATDPNGYRELSREWPLPVMGRQVRVSATFTRPNDTTAYAAGDVVADSTASPTVLVFANAVREAGGSGYLVGATLVDSANQATKGQFELWLFRQAPTATADNAAFAPSDAEVGNVAAIVQFNSAYVGNATAGADGNCIYQGQIDQPAICAASGDTNLYGVLVVRNAYTPVANEQFTVSLIIAQD